MSFVKRGDAEIISVFQEEKLNDQQKKSVEDHHNKLPKDANKLEDETLKKIES